MVAGIRSRPRRAKTPRPAAGVLVTSLPRVLHRSFGGVVGQGCESVSRGGRRAPSSNDGGPPGARSRGSTTRASIAAAMAAAGTAWRAPEAPADDRCRPISRRPSPCRRPCRATSPPLRGALSRRRRLVHEGCRHVDRRRGRPPALVGAPGTGCLGHQQGLHDRRHHRRVHRDHRGVGLGRGVGEEVAEQRHELRVELRPGVASQLLDRHVVARSPRLYGRSWVIAS